MLNREDEYVHNNRGDPEGYIDYIQPLENKTN